MGIQKPAARKNGKEIIGKSGNEYRSISGCAVCSGAIFPYKSEHAIMRELYHCFLCGRFHIYKNGKYELWVTPHIVRKHKGKTEVSEVKGLLSGLK